MKYIEIGKKYIGKHEDTDNVGLTEFLGIDPSETPWCTAFVNACLSAAGLPALSSLRARDYATYGEIGDGSVGDIAVWRNHVAFVAETSPLRVLGGNQSDKVNISPKEWYDKYSEFIGYRRPMGNTAGLKKLLADYSDDEIKTEYDRRFGHDVEDAPTPESISKRTVSANDLANALMQEFIVKHKSREEVMIPDTGETVKVQPFRLTDAEYKLPTRAELEAAIEETRVDEMEYEATDWDCEDFARRFVSKMHEKGIKSAGRVMAWSGNHAFNIVAVQGNPVDFVYVEPQTDEIVELGAEKYDVSNALIIIS